MILRRKSGYQIHKYGIGYRVNGEDNTILIEIENITQNPPELTILKFDEEGNYLEGAEFDITLTQEQNGRKEVVFEVKNQEIPEEGYTVPSEEIKIKNLYPISVLIKEVKYPGNPGEYLEIEDIEFDIQYIGGEWIADTAHGTGYMVLNGDNEVIILVENYTEVNPVKLSLLKQYLGNPPDEKAEFEIVLRQGGVEIASWAGVEPGEVEQEVDSLEKIEVIITETFTPEGYEGIETITFYLEYVSGKWMPDTLQGDNWFVTEDGETVVMTVVNKSDDGQILPVKITLNKTYEGPAPVIEAQFKITISQNGMTIGGGAGRAVLEIEANPINTDRVEVTITETFTPPDYKGIQTVSFFVTYDTVTKIWKADSTGGENWSVGTAGEMIIVAVKNVVDEPPPPPPGDGNLVKLNEATGEEMKANFRFSWSGNITGAGATGNLR